MMKTTIVLNVVDNDEMSLSEIMNIHCKAVMRGIADKMTAALIECSTEKELVFEGKLALDMGSWKMTINTQK